METTTIHLLDRWKQKNGIQSDNAAAIRLKITRATVSGWRNGKHHSDAGTAAKMAEECGLDVLAVLAAIEADRATKPESRKVWSRYGRGAFVALALMAAGAPIKGAEHRIGTDSWPYRPLCEVPRWRRKGGFQGADELRRPRPVRLPPRRYRIPITSTKKRQARPAVAVGARPYTPRATKPGRVHRPEGRLGLAAL